MRFHLKGNFEPEAFSTDGRRLFMISYLPPTQPASYRVVGLNLRRGTVFPLFGREKEWVGQMSGTRLMQTPAPDGVFLFTLYSSQPPKYAHGYDYVEASATKPVAFVHTLNLDFGQAVCVGLPKTLWGGNPRFEAIGSSGADSRVYVVDTSRGLVAVMSSDTLNVIQTAKVGFGLPAVGSQTEAALSPDGRSLFVSTGRAIVALDAMTLVPVAKWNLPGTVSGLGVSNDGARLYVAMPSEVEALNATNGTRLWGMRVPGVEGIRSVSPAA
jgi:outer membrane protein assembly factor BamB